ncbi:MAG: putative transcriptional regulator YebC [Candidatus Westeberhardia cardiocondylae]|nr:putative transcriptional regulator YebC [Candidatus Westeberhardia cardiocondylae]
MAGHNKWSKIKHKKILQDKKRGEKFTKILRKLKTTYMLSKINENFHPKLQSLIHQALSKNIKKNTLYRAMYHQNNKNKIIQIHYEGYGPGGIAIVVECCSTNHIQTLQKIRYTFKKFGGKLSANGSVMHLFKKIGMIKLSFKKVNENNEDDAIKIALKIMAEDIKLHKNGTFTIYTTEKNFEKTKNKLNTLQINFVSSAIIIIPVVSLYLSQKYILKSISLIEALKNFQEVTNIYHNGKLC